jgi:hypothetical protein
MIAGSQRNGLIRPLSPDCPAYDFFGSIFLRRVYEASAVFDCCPKRFDTSTVIPGAESDLGQASTCVGQFS